MGSNQDDEIEVDLKELFYVLKHKIWIVFLMGIVGSVAAGLFTTMVMTPVYTSSTMLYIVNKTTTLTSLTDLQLGTQLTKDYKVLVTSRPVTKQVIEDLGLNMTNNQLAGKIRVNNPADTRILTISVEDSDPNMAKSIVDQVAKVASVRMAEIMDTTPPNVVEEGEVPTQKTSPSISANSIKGGMAGVMLSSLLIIALFLLNDTIKTPEDVEKYLGLNTLAAIPLFEGTVSEIKGRRLKKMKGGKAS